MLRNSSESFNLKPTLKYKEATHYMENNTEIKNNEI